MGEFHGPRDWGRLLTAMVTPFNKDGSVDYGEAARIATWLVDEQGNDGLVICGTTGESPTLTDDEKLQLLTIVLEAVGDRAAIVFGAGTNDTAHSIHMARAAEKGGAHGIMLVNPYYNKPGQAGLEAHFSTVASETSLPVMLYNIMPRSAINLETSTLLRLAEISNIVAVKEASGNLAQIAEVCAKKPDGFRVYSGDDALILPIMAVGGHGLVSVSAHVAGRDLKTVIENAGTDLAKAQEANGRLTDLVKAVFSAPSPTPIKYLLSQNGFDCEDVRLPLVKLDAAQKAHIDKAHRPFAMA